VPTGLVAKETSTSTVALNWSAASDAASYTVRRASVSGGPYVTVASGVTATSYTDTNLANGVTYYYVVDADNASGESTHSNEVRATPSDVYLLLKMDDGAGTTAIDSTGNGNNATLVNGPTWSTTGKLNSAVALDGVDDYLALPTGVTAGMNAVTLAAWVNLDAANVWSRIFDFGSGTGTYMFLTPKAGGSNAIRSTETARVHHATRRCGHRLAVRGARTAGRADAAHRCSSTRNRRTAPGLQRLQISLGIYSSSFINGER